MKKKRAAEEDLVKLFGSRSRGRILTLLFERIGQSLYQREIVFETGLSLQAVQRELKNLMELGILRCEAAPSRVFYRVNTASPYFPAMKKLCIVYREKSG